MNSCLKVSVSASTVLILTACAGGGGGGGGSGGGGVVITPFTSWSAIQPNTTVQATGGSVQVSYTSNFFGTITGVTIDGIRATGATYTATYGSSLLEQSTFQSAQGVSVTLDRNSPSYYEAEYGAIAYSTNGTTTQVISILVDHPATQWNYQSYGIWITGLGTGAGTIGALSVGAPTQVSGIPATGSATFNGYASGVYLDTTSNPFLTNADMRAIADFGSRSINFSTRNTVASAFDGSGASIATPLNMSGTLTYSSGTNQFSGAISTTGSAMTGTAVGTFYGPNANEIGGTFGVTGSGGQGMIGAFGGKQ